MVAPDTPSPFEAPKVDLELLGPRPSAGRVGLGIGLVIVSLLILMLSLWLVLDPEGQGPRYWARVGIVGLMGAGGLRTGWKMGGGQRGGFGWCAIPIGTLLLHFIPELP